MSYEVVKLACGNLTELERMKLAQYLIQTSVQAMEEKNPKVQVQQPITKSKASVVADVEGRVLKSRPSKVSTMKNFISTMFNFQGGISSSEVDIIIEGLKKKKLFKIDGNKIVYLQSVWG